MKGFRVLKNNMLDVYFEIAMTCDALIVLGIWFWPSKWYIYTYNILEKDKPNQLNVISNLIGTSVSLTGFILAALTIIITVKSNIKAKGIDDLDNALEFLLSSKNYQKIVLIFRTAIAEFVFCFIALYVFWIASDSINVNTILKVVIAGTTIVSVTIFRSLLLLFQLLGIEKYNRNGS